MLQVPLVEQGGVGGALWIVLSFFSATFKLRELLKLMAMMKVQERVGDGHINVYTYTYICIHIIWYLDIKSIQQRHHIFDVKIFDYFLQVFVRGTNSFEQSGGYEGHLSVLSHTLELPPFSSACRYKCFNWLSDSAPVATEDEGWAGCVRGGLLTTNIQ